MAVIYDTNFLILFVRDSSQNERIRSKVNPNKEAEYISLVSVAELKSFAVKNKWGKTRTDKMQVLINSLNVLDINDPLVLDKYVDVDSFSQRKHPLLNAAFRTPRNMGKNDIWIAATACVLAFRLVTTDADFDHLDKILVIVDRYLPETLL